MKKIISSVLVSIFALSGIAFAQTTANTSPATSDSQTVSSINKDAQNQISALQKQMNDEIKAVRAKYQTQIDAIRKAAGLQVKNLQAKNIQIQQERQKMNAQKGKTRVKNKPVTNGTSTTTNPSQ